MAGVAPRPPPAREGTALGGAGLRPPLHLRARGCRGRTWPPPLPAAPQRRARPAAARDDLGGRARVVFNDARTGMPAGVPAGAMCVQRFDDSLNSAIRITYRISLRSSSMPEPRDPLLKVVMFSFCFCFAAGRAGTVSRRPRARRFQVHGRVVSCVYSVMIPPLVHQRRPCYDFYFL